MSSGLEAVQLVSEYFNKSCVQLFVLSFQPDCKKINFLNQSNFGLYCELSRIFSASENLLPYLALKNPSRNSHYQAIFHRSVCVHL